MELASNESLVTGLTCSQFCADARVILHAHSEVSMIVKHNLVKLVPNTDSDTSPSSTQNFSIPRNWTDSSALLCTSIDG